MPHEWIAEGNKLVCHLCGCSTHKKAQPDWIVVFNKTYKTKEVAPPEAANRKVCLQGVIFSLRDVTGLEILSCEDIVIQKVMEV